MTRFNRISTMALAAIFLLVGTVDGFANAAFMITTGPTSTPIGDYEFCLRMPQECRPGNSDRRRLVLTPKLWQKMLDVNFRVNTTIKPETDLDLYGKKEYWTYPTTAGDCEDYALLKRRELMQAGIPGSDLLLAVVTRPDGEGHAVLTVRTDRGDFILDNLRARIDLWSDTSYTYLKLQSPLDPREWDKINDARPALVGSIK